jgi:DNA-binding CsgD family transcriptional regulator
VSINPPAGPVPSQPGPPYPVPGPGSARAHVRRLRRDGRTYRAIAAAAGLAPATVSDLDRGRRRPNHGTTTAVLAVTSQAVPHGRVDAGGTRLRLRALHVMGHGSARIARALGVREMTIRQIVRGDTRTVSPRTTRQGRRPVRHLVGQARPRTHPLRPRRSHRRPQTRHRRQLVRPRHPRRRPARHPRLPASPGLEARRRHRRRPRDPPARPSEEEGPPMTSDHQVTPGLIHDIVDPSPAPR